MVLQSSYPSVSSMYSWTDVYSHKCKLPEKKPVLYEVFRKYAIGVKQK